MIEPGIGTSMYKIGTPFSEIDLSIYKNVEIEDREILKVYKTDEIWFFVNAKSNKLDQLSLFSPFNEKTKENIGIGSYLSEVYEHYGECAINHKVHEPKGIQGIAFETKHGSKAKNATIECISVSEPYPYYG